MVWHQTGDKQLSEPMMALFTEVYMRHLAIKVPSKIYFARTRQ